MVTSSTSDRLDQIASVTDADLAHLNVEDLLLELLERVRSALNVDTAAVLLLDPRSNTLVATAARGIEEEVTQGVRIPVGRGFAGLIAAERRPVILDRVDHTTVLNPILRERGIRSLLGVPLLFEGKILGVLHVGALTARAFTAAETEFLQLVADRIALATKARLSDGERTAAVALQSSLLPGHLPDVPGLEFAGRYLPGGGMAVGGDWYDVFMLEAGSVCVVMGDVAGRGLRAATIMGRIRSSLRSYALLTDDPAAIITLVDRKLQHFEPGEMATVLVAMFEPARATVTVSSGGHLPPVLAFPDGRSQLVDIPIDPPLGAASLYKRTHVTLAMPPAAVLCLYTDGLVERRDADIDSRLAQLVDTLEPGTPEATCARVVRRLIGADAPQDDVAVLVVRRTNEVPGAPLDLELPAVPASLRRIRASLRQWLAAVEASPDETLDVLLAVGEAAANSVEHAYGAAGGTVTVHIELDGGDVVVQVRDTGHWRAPRGEDRGRGTEMMKRVSDDLQVLTGSQGTDVLIRYRIGR